MSNRPNLIGSKVLFTNPAESVFSAANITAIAGACTNSLVQPYAYTAVVADKYDARNFGCAFAGATIPIAGRLAFGVFLQSHDDKGNGIVLYSVKGSLKVSCADVLPLNIYPIFGRLNSTAPTSTLAAPANNLSSYVILPHILSHQNEFSAAKTFQLSVDQDVVKIPAGNPVFAGFVIDNVSGATAAAVNAMYSSIVLQAYVDDHQVFSPFGR